MAELTDGATALADGAAELESKSRELADGATQLADGANTLYNGVVARIIVEFFPNALIQIFGAANESIYYTNFAVKAFRIDLCMMIFACVNKATFIFFQAMGKAVESTLLSMVREIVFGVGFALLLPCIFGLDGVLYSMPASDILTVILSAILIVRTYRHLGCMTKEPTVR